MKMELRDYQKEGLDKIADAEARGVKRQLGVAATGLGKTILFSALAERRNEPTLILAHRDELIAQAVDKLLGVWPEAKIGVVKAARNEWDNPVVVASVQTLSRDNRLSQIPQDRFRLVVTDEAHHSKADSYRKIYDHLGIGNEGGPLHLGVTATPDRGDGKGLDDIFDEIVFSYDLLWGIRAGYLSDMRGLRVYLKDLDTKSIRVSKGDYEAGAAGQALEDVNAPEQVAEAWVKYGENRKTIAFWPTVATAQQFADELGRLGVVVGMVSAGTHIDERRDILARFADDKIKVMSNCAVLTEGFDDPSVACILMARPTKARSLYAQCVGRGSRRHPDKKDCLVMDVCGATAHNLMTIPSLFGIHKEEDFEDGEVTVAEAMLEQEEAEVRKGKMEAAAIELFRKVIESPIAWVAFDNHYGRKTYTCSLGGGLAPKLGTVVIEHLNGEGAEQWHCYLRWGKETPPDDATNLRQFPNEEWYRTLVCNVDLEMGLGVGEDYIRKNGMSHLVNRGAKWREGEPSKAQLDLAVKLNIRGARDMNKGDLSEAITAAIEAKKAKNRNRRTPEWVKQKIANERSR